MRSRLAFTLLFTIGLIPFGARAQWEPDGVALSTAAGNQDDPAIISDGAGGVIVTWTDFRSGANSDIYVRRVNALGVPQWTAHGVALCTAANIQSDPTIVSDGAGGAIVTWLDFRSGSNADVYVQRVNASGVPQWTANGVALCTAANDQTLPTIVSDGAAGAIVTWNDYRSGTSTDIYAQRVNALGTPQWTANGVGLCTAAFDQIAAMIVSDGAGGAIIPWADGRSASSDIYAQRVNALGTPQWTANGVALCTAAGDQVDPTIVLDGAAGAIVTWHDFRSGTNNDIYAQRVNASGVPQWTANGVTICTAAGDQADPTIAVDGGGGAIVTWWDNRATNYDIYAQRVDASGAPQWTTNGVALCAAANTQSYPTIVSDGAGGAIVTWRDRRSGTNYDIYAQRVKASGAPQWTANGAALCTAASEQLDPTIASDGAGGAIVTWSDFRSGANSDNYAQRVEGRYGYWGHPESVITSVADIPGDQGGRVKVNWTASGRDALNLQTITEYSIWRATEPVAAAAAVANDPSLLIDPSEIGPDFRGPALRVEHTAVTDYYWEWVGNQNAQYFQGYRFSAATSADSTSQGTMQHHFQVLSHTNDRFTFWVSNTMSGHSVDNLAPAPPLMLTAQRVGSDVNLRWNRVTVPDLRDYSIYRATSSGVTAVPINFLSSVDDTVLVDASAPGIALYYVVTAKDIHENQSPPSNEASVSAITVIGNTPPITAFAVLQNHPNPFAETTVLEIGLPADSDVEIEVYDVSGRRVQSSRLHGAKGWQRVVFHGRDESGRSLASGVYFYRVTAAGGTITRKLVITR